MLSIFIRLALILGWLKIAWSHEPDIPEDFAPYRVTEIKGSSGMREDLAIQQENRLGYLGLFNNSSLAESPTPTVLEQLLSFMVSASPRYQTYILFDNTYPEMTTLLKMFASKYEQATLIKFLPDVRELHSNLVTQLTVNGFARRNIVTLCSTDNVAAVFETVAAKNMEKSQFRWMVVGLTDNEDEMKSRLQNVLREGSQVAFAQIMSPTVFRLQSSRCDEKGKIRFQNVCVWTSGEGTCPNNSKSHILPSIKDIYSNFHGRQLIATAQEDSPFFNVKKHEMGVVGVSGVDFSILNALGDVLNFTHRLLLPPDGKWGGPTDDGKVVGMIGLVSRREADIAICEMSINIQRESVTDFTYPYFVEPVTIVSNAPGERQRVLAALSPFTLPVWACIAAATILIGPVLDAETAFIRNYYVPGDASRGWRASDFAFNMFRSLICQANLIESQYWAHRFTFFFWYLFSFLVFVEYSGILTASLVTPSFEKPIDSLVDLPRAVAGGATIGLIEDSSFDQLFKESRGNLYAQTYALLNHKDRSRSFLKYAEEGFDRIVVEKYTILNGLSGSRTRAAQRGLSRFHFGRETFAPQFYGISCFRGAPFIPKFNQLLSRMVATGLINKWLEDEIEKHRGNHVVDDDPGPKAISLRHLQAAFYIIPIGYILAILAFGIEVLVSTKKSRVLRTKLR